MGDFQSRPAGTTFGSARQAPRFSLTKQRRRDWCGIFLGNGTAFQEEDRSRGPWEVGSPQGDTCKPEDKQRSEAMAHGLPLPSPSPWQLGSARCDFSCHVPGSGKTGATCRAVGDRGRPLLGCQEPASVWSARQEVLSDVAGEFHPNGKRTSVDFSGTGKPQEPPVPHRVGHRSSVCSSHKGPLSWDTHFGTV